MREPFVYGSNLQENHLIRTASKKMQQHCLMCINLKNNKMKLCNVCRRLLKRDSTCSSPQSGMRSRPPSRMTSNTSGNYGSRRNLQSSVESSVCTDNRSEVTGKAKRFNSNESLKNVHVLSRRIWILIGIN